MSLATSGVLEMRGPGLGGKVEAGIFYEGAEHCVPCQLHDMCLCLLRLVSAHTLMPQIESTQDLCKLLGNEKIGVIYVRVQRDLSFEKINLPGINSRL